MKRKAELSTDPTNPQSTTGLASEGSEAKKRRRTSKTSEGVTVEKKEKKKKAEKERSSASEPPQTTEASQDFIPLDDDKPKKKKKKSKQSKSEDVSDGVGKEDTQATTPETATASKKRKHKDKNKTPASDAPNGDEASAPEPPLDPPSASEDPSSDKKARFIVFIGNLPYTATTASLQSHLAALQPTSIRLLTHKEDKSKSRGIAFVEFDHYGRMEACLERYHHSEFDDGVSPARKINVELTAGGGGKKKNRKEKIKVKNAKLREERANRVKKEEKQRDERRKAKGEVDEHDDVHPSRRGQVPKGA